MFERMDAIFRFLWAVNEHILCEFLMSFYELSAALQLWLLNSPVGGLVLKSNIDRTFTVKCQVGHWAQGASISQLENVIHRLWLDTKRPPQQAFKLSDTGLFFTSKSLCLLNEISAPQKLRLKEWISALGGKITAPNKTSYILQMKDGLSCLHIWLLCCFNWKVVLSRDWMSVVFHVCVRCHINRVEILLTRNL